MNPWIQPIVLLLLGSSISFIVTSYLSSRKRKQESELSDKENQTDVNQKLFNRIIELEKQNNSLAQTVLPLSTAFQAILVKELTHFHTPEMDKLLAKLGPPYSLTLDDESRLTHLLLERMTDKGVEFDESEKEAALILPYVMKRVRRDTLTLASMELMIVPRNLLR